MQEKKAWLKAFTLNHANLFFVAEVRIVQISQTGSSVSFWIYFVLCHDGTTILKTDAAALSFSSQRFFFVCLKLMGRKKTYIVKNLT